MRVLNLVLVAGIAGIVALGAAPSWADSGGGRVRMEDRCDPTTFNANVAPGVCVKDGGVTFSEFVAALNPKTGGHHGWKFEDSSLGIESGTTLHVTNVGGETHSFTEVTSFGKTTFAGLGPFLPLLNAALPPGTPDAVTVAPTPAGWNFVPSGTSLDLAGLTNGTHRFQCMIHPWMRTTVAVGDH